MMICNKAQYLFVFCFFFIVHESSNRKLGFFHWVSEYAPGICALRCSQSRSHLWFTKRGTFHWTFVWLACITMTASHLNNKHIYNCIFLLKANYKSTKWCFWWRRLIKPNLTFRLSISSKRNDKYRKWWKLLKWVWKHVRIGFNKIFMAVQKAYSLYFYSRFPGLFLHERKPLPISWVPCVRVQSENKICMLSGRAFSVSRTSNYYFTLPAALKLRLIQTVIPVDS